MDGNNYLFPANTEIANENDIKSHCVNLTRIISEFAYAGAEKSFLILDTQAPGLWDPFYRQIGGWGLARVISSDAYIMMNNVPGCENAIKIPTAFFTETLVKFAHENKGMQYAFDQAKLVLDDKSQKRMIPWQNKVITPATIGF